MNNRIKTLVGGLVLAAMATAVYVVLPGGSTVNHVAYGAALVGIVAMVLSTLVLGRDRAALPQDAVFPLTAWGYLAANLFLSALALVLVEGSYWAMPWPVFIVAHTLLLGTYALRFLALAAGKEHIDRVGEVAGAKVTDWRLLLADLEALKDRLPTGLPERERAARELQAVYEAFRYSDPISKPPTADLDDRLKVEVAVLGALVPTGGVDEITVACGKLLQRLKDRNTRVKALK